MINLQDNDGVRYLIAGTALVVLLGAIAFSKRSGAADMGAGEAVGSTEGEPVHAVQDGDPPEKLALDALDRWIMDLGDEDAALRAQLRAARSALEVG